jgi:hypothetical protein
VTTLRKVGDGDDEAAERERDGRAEAVGRYRASRPSRLGWKAKVCFTLIQRRGYSICAVEGRGRVRGVRGWVGGLRRRAKHAYKDT